MRKIVPTLLSVVAIGCGPDALIAVEREASIDEGVEIVESELNASLILQFVNSAEADFLTLWKQVGVDGRATRGIVDVVFGADETFGTADDRRFQTIAQLDAIPYVGPAALSRLDFFVTNRFGPESVNVEGVAFTAQEAKDALTVANGADLAKVGLTSTAYDNVVAARPLSTVAQIGAVAYVGPSALTTLRTYVQTHPIAPVGGPAACNGTGGTYDGVAFTKDQECHAVHFINRARFSEMSALPETARGLAYDCAPGRVCGFRTSRWQNLTEFSNIVGIGPTAMNALKTAAAGWTANGLSYDTVASTWANRTTLVGKPVLFEKVYVTKRLPDRPSSQWYTWECAEFRDSPTAANYFAGCYQIIGADSAPMCGNGGCLENVAGTWVSLRGTLANVSGHGYTITLAHRRLAAPSPNVP